MKTRSKVLICICIVSGILAAGSFFLLLENAGRSTPLGQARQAINDSLETIVDEGANQIIDGVCANESNKEFCSFVPRDSVSGPRI